MSTGLRMSTGTSPGTASGIATAMPAGRPARAGAMAWSTLLLGVAGVLPALPLVGSFAAMVCAGVWLRDHDLDTPGRTQVLAGLLLGVLGILAALVLTACGLLGLLGTSPGLLPGQ